jgi:hypothetical protein
MGLVEQLVGFSSADNVVEWPLWALCLLSVLGILTYGQLNTIIFFKDVKRAQVNLLFWRKFT